VNPNPADIAKATNGLMVRKDGLPQIADPDVSVVSGFLESSNVNAVHELTEILGLARQFELEVRMMQTAQTNDEAASQLVKVS
jgi:flagellar basal-body rod protein FlgF